MSRSPHIVLVANGSHLNRGCQAIDYGTVEILRRAMPGVSIESAPFDDGLVQWADEDRVQVTKPAPAPRRCSPRWVADRVAERVPAQIAVGYHALRFGHLAETTRGADVVLSLGGDNYGLDYGRPDIFWGLGRRITAMGVPFVLWGCTVGSFGAGTRYERFAAREIGRATAVFARDDLTVEYLRRLDTGVPVVRMGDPAFVMSPVEPHGRAPGLVVPEGAVGLNLSPLAGELVGCTPAEWKARATDVARELARVSDRPLVLVGHVFRAHADDYALLAEVAGVLAAEGVEVSLLPQDLTAREIKWAVARLHSFVGARTHATIAAFSCAVPTISVAYSRKAYGINLDLLGTSEWVIDAADLTSGSLVKRWRLVAERHEEVSSALKQGSARAAAQAFAAGERLSELIDTLGDRVPGVLK